MESKSTLRLYREHKKNIKEEQWVDNTEGSKLLTRGRTNTLELNWRKRHQGLSEKCPGCDCDSETLEHFLIECNRYDNQRLRFNFMTDLQSESDSDKLKNILAFSNLTSQEIEIRKQYVTALWKERRKL